MTVRTRFAPSPTGYLHIGGVRTALYSWLYARHFKGEFILRIEDTDLERSTPESVKAILDGMLWCGLDFDEGPFYQMQRMDRYRECIQKLLAEGKAYRCYCSKERLDKMREDQQKQGAKPRYDGHCRDHNADSNQPHVVRFKNPEAGSVVWDDLVKGSIEIANSELDDLIIARTDGTPTYNFTVAVDDWDMTITHVIRGDDHVNNTPRQINILEALGAALPRYGHIPMVLGEDGKRLSKRHGAVSVLEYHEQGYLPEAFLNYLARVGWSHGNQEIFSIEELIQYFDGSSISRSPASFDTQKLNWLNQHYMKTLPVEKIRPALEWQCHELQLDLTNGPALDRLIPVMAERVNTLKELAAQIRYFYLSHITIDADAAQKHLRPVALEPLQMVRKSFESLKEWQAHPIHEAVQKTAESLNIGMGKIGMPLRVAVTGVAMSPAIDITCELIGKERVLQRIDQAIKLIEQRVKQNNE